MPVTFTWFRLKFITNNFSDIFLLTSTNCKQAASHAASRVRTSKINHSRNLDATNVTIPTAEKELTDRRINLKGFSDIIREQGEKGIGTGADRLR